MAFIRLAEVLAGLSLTSDLGMGHGADQSLRSGLTASRLASRLGVTGDASVDVYFGALLQHVGCTADAFELAVAFGDDVAAHAAGSRTDFSRPRDVFSTYVPELVRGRPLAERMRLLSVLVRRGKQVGEQAQRADCEVGSATARRLGLPASTQAALLQMFECWNGAGVPGRLRGDEIVVPTRIVQVASLGALFGGLGGPEAAASAVSDRAARTLDPAVAAAFVEAAAELLAIEPDGDLLAETLAAEPEPRRLIAEPALDEVAAAFGDLADLKAPFFYGHARGVAELAAEAAERAGLAASAPLLRRAGHLHDIGRVAVSSGIWAKAAPLAALEWEQVRLHAYHGERILSRSEALQPASELAALHHERQDGSGYHRRLRGNALPAEARLLAAADVFVALGQERPHRPARDGDAAAAALRDEAKAGRLDPEFVAAVLAAAGAQQSVRQAWPDGLTGRQVEVLRLLARGLSNREIGERLTISPRTAEHHVQDAYARIGVSTRAAAAIYALEHGLLTAWAEDG